LLICHQLFSSASAGQRTLARITAADAAQVGEELRSELALVKDELQKLKQLNANLRDELVAEKEKATRQLAGAKADAEDVAQELRRSIGDLKCQLKQQVSLGCLRALEFGIC
jgi:hypothetical protein